MTEEDVQVARLADDYIARYSMLGGSMLDEFCSAHGMSRRTVQRHLKATGYTWQDRVDLIRIGRSSELLRSTIMTIEEVANEIGYKQHSHFTKKFKKRFGMTPSEYRERIRAGRVEGAIV